MAYNSSALAFYRLHYISLFKFKHFKGLMPVALHFDRVVESDYDLVDKSSIEKEFGVTMNEKWRKNQNFSNVSVSERYFENNIRRFSSFLIGFFSLIYGTFHCR